MTNSTIALILVLTMNLLLALTNTAMTELNDDGPVSIYNCSNTIMDSISGCQQINEGDIISRLPDSAGSNPSTVSQGNVFTDIFASIKSFFNSIPGIGYLDDIVTAFHRMLVRSNLPEEFVVFIDIFWYGITFFIIVSYFFGRE